MKTQLAQFLLAVQFLTRLRVARWIDFRPEDLPRSAKYFPLVGAMIGAMSALVFSAAQKILPDYIAILCAMLTNVLLTGALHEDGFADVMDSLGAATRERALEIMRDSRIGSFSALALWFSMTMKFFALQWLRAFEIPLWPILIAAPLLSRCAGVALLATCKSARPDSPTSAPFIGAVSKWHLVFAVVYTMFLTVVVFHRKDASRITLAAALGIVFFSAMATLCCRTFFQRRLGGITGDCLGATIHTVEVGNCLFLTAVAKVVISHAFGR